MMFKMTLSEHLGNYLEIIAYMHFPCKSIYLVKIKKIKKIKIIKKKLVFYCEQ